MNGRGFFGSLALTKNLKIMTFENFKKLRSEISLGSCYISDYNNTLGYTPESVSDLFELYDDQLDQPETDKTLFDFWENTEIDNYLVEVDADYIADKYRKGYLVEKTTHINPCYPDETIECFKVWHKDSPEDYAIVAEQIDGDTIVFEYSDGELNSQDELSYEWWDVDEDLAYKIARYYI